ncbi:MAG: Lrp/AsnC family transcriptional regulator, partial [Oscillospiraceae bacterium]
MNKKLLALLKQNARLTNAELSAMLGITEQEVAAGIKQLEDEGIIIGYSAIVNEEKADDNAVTAIIELKVTPFKDRGFDDL